MALPDDRRSGAPLPLIGRLVSPLYAWEVSRRNRAFDRGAGVTRLDLPVLSVGNLSVGGTGKTPTVRWLYNELRALGKRPLIAMRGYKAQAGEASDEEAEYHATLADCLVAAEPDRVAGISRLRSEHPEIDCVLLDDGFQHRRLARDLDIVLIDATRSPFDDDCLPAGWLREPVRSLERAHAVVLTRTDGVRIEEVAALEGRLHTEFPHLITTGSQHSWSGYRVGAAPELRDVLPAGEVHIAAGIGHPTALIRQAERAGLSVRGTTIKRDHHAWTAQEAAELERLGILVLTTEKDWVKLAGVARSPERYARPVLDMRVDDPGPLLERVRLAVGLE